MGSYQIPVPDPSKNPYGVYGYGYGPYAGYNQNKTGAVQNSMNFDPSTGFTQDINPNAPMEDVYASNRAQINTTGNMIGGEAGNQLNYFGPRQQEMDAAQTSALNDLKQTPGYTGDEASKIGSDYGKFNTSDQDFNSQYMSPEEQAKSSGDPNAPAQGVESGLANEGAMLNQYQGMVGGQLEGYGKNLGGSVSQLGSGLDKAQGKFSGLDSAVNDPSLGFDPNQTEKQLTDTDVQNMRTAAGVSAGNQFRTAEDTLERQAAQSGNASPTALAALRERLVTQEAGTAGDVENQAEISAKQAQYQRAAGIEGQREGAAQTQQGMRATASTTEEAAAQAAAGQAGQAGISAAENLGAANLGAVRDYGQFSTNQANQMTGQRFAAQSQAEQEAATRANALAQNRQSTQANVNNSRYAQGTGSQQLTSKGAETTGNARIAGEGAYRTGVQGQQALSQQGGQAALGAQQAAFQTQTTGQNQNAGIQSQFEVQKPSFGDSLGKVGAQTIGTGLGLFGGGHADGAIITEPETTTLGEQGPELVVPIGRYRSARRNDEMRFAA